MLVTLMSTHGVGSLAQCRVNPKAVLVSRVLSRRYITTYDRDQAEDAQVPCRGRIDCANVQGSKCRKVAGHAAT